jgi:thioredoxin reductase (NADPH)
MTVIHKVIIVGSGPAAHTAAIYAARADLHPVMFEGFMAAGIAAGGQLTTTTEVENFPGFPQGISGPELMERMREQSIRCGTTIHTSTITETCLTQRPFMLVDESGKKHFCHSLIIATGASAKRLEIPGAGEGEYWQRGVSACAVCDGALPCFRGKRLVVVGGGDSAMEEACYLSKFASEVLVVHRRDELRASAVMQQRAKSNPKIRFLYWSAVTEVLGDGKLMQQARIKNLQTGAEHTEEAGGLFFAVGHVPSTGWLSGQVALDEQGYVVTKPGFTSTSIPGVFAAGDVQDRRWRQAVTAAGTGCMAALEAEHWLSEQPGLSE